MSAITGQIGKFQIKWFTAPHSTVGEGEVEIAGKKMSVRWKKDDQGLWLELPHGVFGYDVTGTPDDDTQKMHYILKDRVGDRVVKGVRFKSSFEAETAAASGGTKKSVRVRAQMPGKIVRVMVKPGDLVTKDQPLIVMEAMKMENEIRASQAGKVESLGVTEGQAVETGADLLKIGSVT